MTVARLLYLAKCAKPDILAVERFLCTRVKEPMVEDVKKFAHLFGYLERMKDEVMVLKPRRDFGFKVYVDATFAGHPDGKSHSRVIAVVVVVFVYFSSKKQKCVSKSPMEAALIALLDNVGVIELFHELLSII
jgi:hypothetical protein